MVLSRMNRVPAWSKTCRVGRPVEAVNWLSVPVAVAPDSWLPTAQYSGMSSGRCSLSNRWNRAKSCGRLLSTPSPESSTKSGSAATISSSARPVWVYAYDVVPPSR